MVRWLWVAVFALVALRVAPARADDVTTEAPRVVAPPPRTLGHVQIEGGPLLANWSNGSWREGGVGAGGVVTLGFGPVRIGPTLDGASGARLGVGGAGGVQLWYRALGLRLSAIGGMHHYWDVGANRSLHGAPVTVPYLGGEVALAWSGSALRVDTNGRGYIALVCDVRRDTAETSRELSSLTNTRSSDWMRIGGATEVGVSLRLGADFGVL